MSGLSLQALVAILLLPNSAHAQIPGGKVPRLLHVASSCQRDDRDASLEEGLRQLRYVPNKTIVMERTCYRNADELRSVLRASIARQPDVVVIGSPAGALAARAVTGQIPIVCASCGDPLDNGLVASLARPGGNVTGFASLSAELIGKRFELIEEILPRARRIAAFVNPDNPGTRPTLAAFEQAKRRFPVEVLTFEFRSTTDFAKAFQSAADAKAAVVLLQDDPFTYAARTQIAELALRHHLPTVAGLAEVAIAGGLVAYGPDRKDLYRRSATFVDKVLRGSNPAELPIEQPSQFELIVNAKTARALSLKLPRSFVLRADRIIK